MEKINLPQIEEEKIDLQHSKFIIEPLYPGYGSTIGNSLRRVLLSSIIGAAPTSFKIDGISHEFSSIPHAKEDVVEVIMNLKGIAAKSFSDEPVVIEVSKKGPGIVTAKDFKANSNIEILNPEAHIVTLDKGADFNMEVTIEKGRGFKTVSIETSEKNEIGRIVVDSLFSPVQRVSIAVEDTRVGQMTNYDKLTLEVVTNGTISPKDALDEASAVLVEHYNSFVLGTPEVVAPAVVAEDGEVIEDEIMSDDIDEVNSKTKIEELNFSPRTTNALVNAGIKTVGGLKRLSQLKLEEIKGLGKKGIEEINEILSK